MKLILSLPFCYFFYSRIRKDGSIIFNLAFEFIPWLIISLIYSQFESINTLKYLISSYFAFISIYEIGYIFNDFYSVRFEKNGRLRGPRHVNHSTIITWIIFRLLVFISCSLFLPFGNSHEWIIFYVVLSIIFLFHNLINEKELKVISFFWLAFLKFLAPVIFLVKIDYLSSLCLVSSLIYVPFRCLSYLESKSLLLMKLRKTLKFRTLCFLSPLLFSIIFYQNYYFSLFVVMSFYYAMAILTYFFLLKLKINYFED